MTGSVPAVLRARARSRRCSDDGFIFLQHGQRESGRLSWGDLDRRATLLASLLLRRVAAGDRVLVLLPAGLDYVVALFACWYAGVTAVPLYPPGFLLTASRLRSVIDDCGPSIAITATELLPDLRRLTGGQHVAALTIDEVAETGLAEPPRDLPAGTLALLQYTSGSTGTPRGVRISHANLVANSDALVAKLALSPDDRGLSWLPPYHDMGLIGSIVVPAYVGFTAIHMSPVAYARDPLRWPRGISAHRVTVSGGPDFAYAQCARLAARRPVSGLDLTSWRAAYIGSDTIHRETLDAFAEAFRPAGFRPSAYYATYGLAEFTLMATGAFVAPDGAVGCGAAPPGHRVLIVDAESRRPLPDGQVGEIWLAGPSRAEGYWSQPAESPFEACTAGGDGPFLRTGDLGRVVEGELHVVGRIKDVIVVRGRKHWPDDVERCVQRATSGAAAAFAVDDAMVVVAEVGRGFAWEAAEPARTDVRRALAREGFPEPAAIHLVPRGSLPRTSSGKLRRSECRELWGRSEPADGA